MMGARHLVAALGIGAIAVASGCGPPARRARTTLEPRVAFVSPLPHAVVSGGVRAQVRIEDFVIAANSLGKPARAGEGHLRFSMDGGRYDLPRYSGANGALAVRLGTQGRYSPSTVPEITYRNLPAGTLTLRVFLANNDASNTGPMAKTTFTVRSRAARAGRP